MRCFLALDIPPPVRNYLARLARESLTKGKLRKVAADQMHLTLVFAGDVEPAVVDAMRDALFAVDAHPLQLHLNGLGHFPPQGEPRVVWAGLDGDIDELMRMQAELAARCVGAGAPADDRRFHPHVTLGRVKSAFGAYAIPDQLREVGETLRQKPFECGTLTLYESLLTPGGAIYRPLAQRDLTA